MTASTGKRSFQACLRCRGRKTRCDLSGTGERKEPPCKSCLISGTDCVLVHSRRGHTFKSRRLQTKIAQSSTRSAHEPESLADPTTCLTNARENASAMGSAKGDFSPTATEDEAAIALRNPSDALEILARSGDGLRVRDGCLPASCHPTSASDGKGIPEKPLIFDEYELLRTGVLQASTVSELLQIYLKDYHPLCPIVPEYLLSAIDQIESSDYFLLTVLLTIASRDMQKYKITHQQCWDHTQRLLLNILLAHSSTQVPQTVEGLLLLAEWLPHIQMSQMSDKAPVNLFVEDRLAWSLVGLAIRQGYMLRLDRGAFRGTDDKDSKAQDERKRLIWHFVCLADRHISVRLGQSFWSRGPSSSSHFTAGDFPSLEPKPGQVKDDYAAVLQANLELVQVLYNSHLILYASSERTQALINDGDYARYLDDFMRAATLWEARWKQIKASTAVHASLLLTYEYVCLYVNAFSFQAVLVRANGGKSVLERMEQGKTLSSGDMFPWSIMSSPDGLYLNGATRAATNLLKLMTSLDPHSTMRCLPSRFYLYGIYAAVFLHKAVRTGAIKADTQVHEVSEMIARLIKFMREAPATETHVLHVYSDSLEKLWHPLNTPRTSSQDVPTDLESAICHSVVNKRQDIQQMNPSSHAKHQSGPLILETHGNHAHDGHTDSAHQWIALEDDDVASSAPQVPMLYDDETTATLIDENTINSYWPGIGDLSQLEASMTWSWPL